MLDPPRPDGGLVGKGYAMEDPIPPLQQSDARRVVRPRGALPGMCFKSDPGALDLIGLGARVVYVPAPEGSWSVNPMEVIRRDLDLA